MHDFVRFSIAFITLIVLDLPLKILSAILFIIIGLMAFLLYPVVKRWESPLWFSNWYDYTTSMKNNLCKKVYQLWS